MVKYNVRKAYQVEPMEAGSKLIFSSKTITQTSNWSRKGSDLQDGPGMGVE